MYKYTFTNGDVITSKLEKEELLKRMNRLDILRVLTEGYEEGEGYSIFQKSLRAYNKTNDFTGIIRLNILEKDFLGYLLEGMVTAEEVEAINFYLK
jgi:hypothetical protein